MSHFTVLVQTQTDDRSELEAALQPFHEFECTGIDDQYVIDVDDTDKLWEKFAAATTRVMRAPSGEMFDAYGDRFYREPTTEEQKIVGSGTGSDGSISWTSKDWGDGRGYRTKVHFVPAGYEDIQVPASSRQSFAEWAAEWTGRPIFRDGKPVSGDDDGKYGRIVVDDTGEVIRCIDRTNPNAKWDWWVVGGRYEESGALFLRSGERALVARKADVDPDAWITDLRSWFAEDWDAAQTVLGGERWTAFADMGGMEITERRRAYWAQPAIVKLAETERFRWQDALDNLLLPRTDYIEKMAADRATHFAIVADGKWHQRGQMGWWATVSDEKSDWPAEYRRILAEIPDDAWLTVVDCHI